MAESSDRVAQRLPKVAKACRRTIVQWVGQNVLPHEASVRGWLRRRSTPADADDLLQEAYCRIAGLDAVDHIQDGRAYLFRVVQNLLRERARRSGVLMIDATASFDAVGAVSEDPSPERVTIDRDELELINRLVGQLPPRCQLIFKLRKIDGVPQREIARRLGISEHTVENEVSKGLRLILSGLARLELETPFRPQKVRGR